MAPRSLALIAILLSGCTVTPSIVPSAAPAYSGNVQNGGVIDLGPGGKGPAHVTADWVAAYAALCDTYGKDMVPVCKAGDGVAALPDGTYSVDLEHLADKNVMATLQRSGMAP